MLRLLIVFSFFLSCLNRQSFAFHSSLGQYHHLERTRIPAGSSRDGRSARNLLGSEKKSQNGVRTPLVVDLHLHRLSVVVVDSVEDKGSKNHKDDVHDEVEDSSVQGDSQELTGGSGTFCLHRAGSCSMTETEGDLELGLLVSG